MVLSRIIIKWRLLHISAHRIELSWYSETFCEKIKTGSELMFLRILGLKISIFPFLQMVFKKNVSVLRISFTKIHLFEKKTFFLFANEETRF
jgi:hypothetical protein